jgi:hypothetical protein
MDVNNDGPHFGVEIRKSQGRFKRLKEEVGHAVAMWMGYEIDDPAGHPGREPESGFTATRIKSVAPSRSSSSITTLSLSAQRAPNSRSDQ